MRRGPARGIEQLELRTNNKRLAAQRPAKCRPAAATSPAGRYLFHPYLRHVRAQSLHRLHRPRPLTLGYVGAGANRRDDGHRGAGLPHDECRQRRAWYRFGDCATAFEETPASVVAIQRRRAAVPSPSGRWLFRPSPRACTRSVASPSPSPPTFDSWLCRLGEPEARPA
jgi:hypothetical protein